MGVASRVVGLEALEPEAMRVAGEVAARSTVGAEAREGERQPRVRHAARSGLGARAQVTGGTRPARRRLRRRAHPRAGSAARRRAERHRHQPGAARHRPWRLPEADLREGDMEELPFEEDAFDAVIGVNAFQFAGEPGRALREAARVLGPGGRLVASLFAAPEHWEGRSSTRPWRSSSRPSRRPTTRPMRCRRPATSRPRWPTPACASSATARWCASGATPPGRTRSAVSSARPAAPRPGRGSARRRRQPCSRRSLAPFEEATSGEVTLVNTFRRVAACR